MQWGIKSFPSVAWLAVALLGAALVARAEPITPSGDDDTAAIAAAIEAAAPDGTVELGEGTFLLSSTLTLDQGVTLKGASRDGTILDFQKKCQGFIISHEGAVLRDLTVTKGYIKATDKGKVYGGAIKMSAGLVENCLITLSQADAAKSCFCYGGGIYTSGGTVSGCEFTDCAAGSANITAMGNALYIAGGTVTNCDVHANDAGYSSSSNVGSASGVVCLSSGFLLNSKIHHNKKKSNPGVYQTGGTMANCLVYGNSGSYFAGGLYKMGGDTYYCTIWGNAISGDSTGKSGAYVAGGTMKNCILVGNGPETSTAGSIENVEDNSHRPTIQNCVLDKEISGKNIKDNTNNSDVKFADAANGDFAIASSMSPACGRATPLANYPVDFVGVARDAEAPTAGAYEYVQKTGVFEVDFAFDRPDHVYGEEVTAVASLTGAETNEVTFAWFVDGAVVEGATNSVLMLTPDVGRHTVKVVATKIVGGGTAEKEYEKALDIRPTTCYVNETGSGTYPYATPQTATNSLNEALTTVWTASEEKARIFVAGGTYRLSATMALNKPVELVGEGRDEVFVTGYKGRAFSVSHAEAVLSGVTVTNCQSAFEISKGLIRDCRAIDLGGSRNESGGGYDVSGGRVENCEAINCRENNSGSSSQFCYGAGLRLSGGVVSNFLCRGCIMRPSQDGDNARGGSVYATGGSLVDATIEDSCRDTDTGHQYFGANIWGEGCTLERCRFTGLRTAAGMGTRLSNVTARNCLFADNVLGWSYTNFWASGCRFVNCTIASNSNSRCAAYLRNCSVTNTIVAANGPGEEVIDGGTYSHSCAAGLEDGVDGNITADPRFRSVGKADFNLRQSSPCVNAGLKQDGMDESTDLAGNPRVRDGEPDMGCFETIFRGLMLLLW